jgi:hypothetical protein
MKRIDPACEIRSRRQVPASKFKHVTWPQSRSRQSGSLLVGRQRNIRAMPGCLEK